MAFVRKPEGELELFRGLDVHFWELTWGGTGRSSSFLDGFGGVERWGLSKNPGFEGVCHLCEVLGAGVASRSASGSTTCCRTRSFPAWHTLETHERLGKYEVERL